MAFNPMIWFEICVSDMPRAVKFYESLLNIELIKTGEGDTEYLMFPYQEGAEGAAGALVKCEENSPGPSGVRVYLASDDCGVTASRVGKHGGRVIKQKSSIGEFGFYALIEDTEGNVIGLHSMK